MLRLLKQLCKMNLVKILREINFKSSNMFTQQDLMLILKIRNEKKVRINMFNNHEINYKEHIHWFNNIKGSDLKKFYIIEFKKKIRGGLSLINIDKDNLSAEWAFYISQEENHTGLGAAIEYKAINYFFETYNLSTLNCFVMNHNPKVIKLHQRFGFKKIDLKKCDNINNFKTKSDLSQLLSLKKKIWYEFKHKFDNQFLKSHENK